jgi:molybdopterin synthase catalytic subunit
VAELVEGPIELERLLAAAARPDCGAVVLFLGTTRDHHEGRRVERLEYEAYRPMALTALEQAERDTVERHAVASCRIVHRLGVVPPAEASVAVVVAAAHRSAAFDACRWAMDRVKNAVPIWKKEHYADGAAGWVEGKKLS